MLRDTGVNSHIAMLQALSEYKYFKYITASFVGSLITNGNGPNNTAESHFLSQSLRVCEFDSKHDIVIAK